MTRGTAFLGVISLLVALVISVAAASAPGLQQRNEVLFEELRAIHGYAPEQIARLRSIFQASGRMGQGNPAVTQHPKTPEACRARLEREGVSYNNPRFEKICGSKYMAPLYDPATQQPEEAKVCIDQFEFPNIPCTYPVVWTRAREAADVCAALGKRMCDAHEWEGACAGRLTAPDYAFRAEGLESGANAFRRMRAEHNARHGGDKVWSYGPNYRSGVCATGSSKNAGCRGGEWDNCGSNTYPAGSFPECRSALGVLDINGNAAEHMNLPTTPDEMSSRGSATLGHTEMKGSWFVWDRIRAHEDWCRWRAPYWHGSRVMSADSHANYHLGFRCCKATGR
jgi:formylglycine-generating enzyme required for sulfatase activity